MRARELRATGLGRKRIARALNRYPSTIERWIRDLPVVRKRLEDHKGTCAQCGQTFTQKRKRRKKFCPSSCSALFNNVSLGRRTNVCVDCGHYREGRKGRCHRCLTKFQEEEAKKRPLRSFFYRLSGPAKFNEVRTWARKLLARSGRDKSCQVCGFDIHVEVCHVNPVSNFPEDTLMGVVNSLENLLYLCPNHHVMLDRGLIDSSSVGVIG